jgi:hypothetical protein
MTASDWKPYLKGTLRGWFVLTLPSGMVIHGCSLHVKTETGARWIGLPQQKVVKAGGEVAYVTILEFTSRATADRFRDLALGALDALGMAQ